MFKVEMKDFIAHMMMECAKGSLFISHVKEAVNYVLEKGVAERWENFDDTPESVLSVILDYPHMYYMSCDNTSISAKEFSALHISEQNPLPKEVADALKEYVEKLECPLYYALSDLSDSDENKKKIDSVYIDWICSKLDKFEQISSVNTCICKTRKDIANFALLHVLHSVVSRYYSSNLITPYVYNGEEGYAFTYTWQGKEINIIIIMREDKIYKVLSIVKRKEISSFEGIINNEPSKLLSERKALIKELGDMFNKAAHIDLSYSEIICYLEDAYDKNPRD